MEDILANWIKKEITTSDFYNFLSKNLMKLCEIDTTPTDDIEEVEKNERDIFDNIAKTINNCGLKGTVERRPFLKSIKKHDFYTLPNYTNLEWPYVKRGNLVYIWKTYDSDERDKPVKGIALNAHVDTVPPFFPPSKKGNYVYGRGACDDKGGCVTILGTLRLLKEISEKFNIVPRSRLICMFVTDEEIGGNGSLSLALDEELKGKYDTLIVLEPSGLQIHPGNRGALWYRIDLDYRDHSKALVLALNIILTLEQEGKQIREESRHPLFDKDFAQTCHGIFGPYGKHPSTVCDEVKFSLKTKLNIDQINSALSKGLKKYINEYGDKTKEIDEVTGKRKVDHHFDLYELNGRYELFVWGKSGHMGAVAQSDNAITKAAFLLNEVLFFDRTLDLDLINYESNNLLTLEGGQGFIPSHSMEEIKERFSKAVEKAWKSMKVITPIETKPVVSFTKLHNEAFAGSPNSKAVHDLVYACELVGITIEHPLKGYPVSCDARIFAKLYPEIDVITMGPGSVKDAHSKDEKVDIRDIALNSGALALFILENGGIIES